MTVNSKWIGQNQYSGLTANDRFLQKVTINANEKGCWFWNGTKMKGRGYGKILYNGKRLMAHRFSYLMYIGDLEDEMVICHKCDDENCVSPFHLFKGTQKENMKDAQDKGRMKIAKCPSISSYKNGCRCDDCKSIFKDYHFAQLKEWRKNNPEKLREQNDRRNERNRIKNIHKPKHKPPTCGTSYKYKIHKCRCELCKGAYKEYLVKQKESAKIRKSQNKS